MSININSMNYFQMSYVRDLLQLDKAAETAAAAEAAGQPQMVTPAPQLTGGGSLLSMKDNRMLAMRDVSGTERTGYVDILRAFQSDPSYHNDPKSFLGKLSNSGIDLLKKAQSLPAGAELDIAAMSKEEALNLILPHTQQTDVNGDGFISGGNGGTTFRFPTGDSPQNVKDAWAEATAGMDEGDELMMQFYFMMELTSANTTTGANGQPEFTRPGDPGWRNVFQDPQYSYTEAVDRFIGNNDYNFQMGGIDYETYLNTRENLLSIQSAFNKFGVA